MHRLICTLFLALWILGCKHKKEAEQPAPLPALAFIRSQVAHVDTSFYPIIKIVRNGSIEDTTYVKREEFAGLASDFLTLSEITDSALRGKYLEESFFDNDLKRVLFTYTTQDENMIIKREEISLIPNLSGGDSKIDRVMFHTLASEGDSTVEKHLSWKMDQYFQVVRKVRRDSLPESTSEMRVVWNQPEQ